MDWKSVENKQEITSLASHFLKNIKQNNSTGRMHRSCKIKNVFYTNSRPVQSEHKDKLGLGQVKNKREKR